MTREQAIDTLIGNDFFNESQIGTRAMEFFIKNLMENTDNLFDIERYARLNTLFGYDIGFENAMRISTWLWCSEINEANIELDVFEISYKHKTLLMKCDSQCGLGLSFDKWKTKHIYCYEYYI